MQPQPEQRAVPRHLAANGTPSTAHAMPRTSSNLLDSFDYFVLFYTPAIWLVGTLCNTLLIVVFAGSRQGARRVRNPTIVMFITIAVADIAVVTVALLSQIFRIWLKWMIRADNQLPTMRANLHPAYVAFVTASFLLEPACSEFSIWSECFLSCARFAAICWPHKLRTWLHYRGTVVTVIALACFAFFLRVPLYVAHLFMRGSQVAARLENTDPYLLLFLRFLIPVVVLVVTTHGILLGLRKSRRQFGRLDGHRKVATGREDLGLAANKGTQSPTCESETPFPSLTVDKLRKNITQRSNGADECCSAVGQVSLVRITFVLVGKNVSYFLFVSTCIILDLLRYFSLISITETTKNLYLYAYMLAMIHHITSFFICLAGGKAFQQETLRVIRRCACYRRELVSRSTAENKSNQQSGVNGATKIPTCVKQSTYSHLSSF